MKTQTLKKTLLTILATTFILGSTIYERTNIKPTITTKIYTKEQILENSHRFDPNKDKQITDINLDGNPDLIIKTKDNNFICKYQTKDGAFTTTNPVHNKFRIHHLKNKKIPQTIEDTILAEESKKLLQKIEKKGITLSEYDTTTKQTTITTPNKNQHPKIYVANKNLEHILNYNNNLNFKINTIEFINFKKIQNKSSNYNKSIALSINNKIIFNTNQPDSYNTHIWIHEFAHAYENSLDEKTKAKLHTQWYKIIGNGNTNKGKTAYTDTTITLPDGGWVRTYSRTNIREDIATLTEHHYLKTYDINNTKIQQKLKLLKQYGFIP